MKEHRITVKSPESAWEIAEERKRREWREAERLVEKTVLKATFFEGTETGTLKVRRME